MAQKVSAATAALDEERQAHADCRRELHSTQSKLEVLEQTRADEKDEMRTAVERLKGMVHQAGSNEAKVAAANRLVSSLEAKVQEQERRLKELGDHHAGEIERERRRSVTSAQETHAKIAELSEVARRAERDASALADISAQYEALKRDHAELERSSEQTRAMLDRSEAERLELRQQYGSRRQTGGCARRRCARFCERNCET